MSDEEREIGQISVYLVKAGVPFDQVIDWEKGITAKRAFADHSFKVEDIECRFLYFESSTSKKNPPWLDFANGVLPLSKQVTFSATSRSPNGIMGFAVEGELFVAAFGRGAGASLIRKAVEPDFGIKVAMNLCGNEDIRQTRTQSHSITPTHIDRQVSLPSDTFTFGLSEAEDLKSISAHMRGEPHVTLQGKDHLTVKIAGDEKLNWSGLIGHCERFLQAYKSKAYVKLFPNYRNFKPASDEEAVKLDKFLIDALRARQVDDLQLWIPEFIAGDEYSFTYSNHAKTPNRIYSHLDPDQLNRELDLDDITEKKLRSKRIYAYSHHEDRVLPYKWWTVYECIIFEHKLGSDYYLLTDGEWKLVDRDFYRSVVDFVQNGVREEPCEAIYKGIPIADHSSMKNREALFNVEACKRRPESIHFDQAKLRIGTDRKDKAFCDILDLTKDGVMRIINCKPFKGSAAITYLFAQTRFYCENFLKDQAFLDAIRGHIQASASPIRDKYLGHIRSAIKDVSGTDYRVCVWLLCDSRLPTPDKSSLPLIAKYELKLMHDYLQQVCKFKEIVLRFIPVSMATYTKQTGPAKKAA